MDSTQSSYLTENCILVDPLDQAFGRSSKRDCHQWKDIQKGNCLHRAFSVFAFNNKNELLMQKRAASKITFPGYWTNTCCSHPLHVPDELDETNSASGVRRAAVRKLQHEIGLKVEANHLIPLTRILYKAPCDDNVWGEHELDYVLMYRSKTVETFLLDINPNEVEAVEYWTLERIQQETETTSGVKLSPWFKLIAQRFLKSWWQNLDRLEEIENFSTIHDFRT